MQKNVLITGASTGIGFAAVKMLQENNFTAIATVRKVADENNLLKTYPGVKILRLDVTDLEEIESLPEKLAQIGVHSLFGVINNAGVALAGPFLHQPFEEVQQTMQINVVAVMKICQILTPIIQPGGRIINISSIAGKTATPFLAVYAASKHAIEGFSDALRKELMLNDIKVIVVGPGTISTPIWQKGFDIIKEKYSHTPFGHSFEIFMKIAMAEVKHAMPVEGVSADLLKALTAKNPKLRYAPIPRKFRNWYLPRLIPARLFDLLTVKVLKLKK